MKTFVSSVLCRVRSLQLVAGACVAVVGASSAAFAETPSIAIDPDGVIRPALLQKALAAREARSDRLSADHDMVIVDYTRHSSRKRLYVVDMETGAVQAFHAAHGRGSDKDHDGWLDSYSNTPNSQASSRGAYAGAEPYFGRHGRSLRLDGLDPDNSNARDRAIVLHAQPRYVSAGFITSHGKLGRSNGCIVVYANALDVVMSALENGGLLYVDGKKSSKGDASTQVAALK